MSAVSHGFSGAETVKGPADVPAPALEDKASSNAQLTQHLLSSPPLPETRKRECEVCSKDVESGSF